MNENMLSLGLRDNVNFGVESDMNTLMGFAKEAGELIDESNYSLEFFSYTKEKTELVLKYDTEYFEARDVKLTFDKEKQIITVASNKECRDSYYSMDFGYLCGGFSRYRRYVEQKVTEFRVKGNNLSVTTAEIPQTAVEDDFGGGYGEIFQFNSIADFERLAKDIVIDKKEYRVPASYRLEDGMDVLDSKMLQKTVM